MLTLDSLPSGTAAKLASFAAQIEAADEQRLRELGFDEGVELTVVRRLPLGGPIIVGFARVEVALRPNEARFILLTA